MAGGDNFLTLAIKRTSTTPVSLRRCPLATWEQAFDHPGEVTHADPLPPGKRGGAGQTTMKLGGTWVFLSDRKVSVFWGPGWTAAEVVKAVAQVAGTVGR
eukprot:CAMPEP_0204366330 /NCGR_PEP_ID=MMETSP0469-20131031/42586_1 /ASSEMBLY_ACC=CAM_ASM_000384 /TAXON_ID=2969 /ORGANISM="Oxyrrhis marina" /LENGTH=99 /DNA_ID=CAMNT_0051355523 /DNA_START=23 /DNA_END=318 /DNA_ORIENTATION=+